MDYSALSVEKRLEVMKDFFGSDMYKTEAAKITSNMSRTERREFDRKGEKLKKCLKSLTPTQLELLEMIAEVKANEKIEDIQYTLDRCISTLFIELFPEKTWEDISNLEDILSNLITEDYEKILRIKQESKGDNQMASKIMQKHEDEIKSRVEKLLEEGISQKEAIQTLIIEFPKLSKSMITNAYKKLKSEYEKANQEEEDPEVQEAAEAIMEIIEEKEEPEDKILEEADKYTKEAEKTTKVVCDGNSCRIEPVEDQAANNNKTIEEAKGLKVIEEKVVKSIKVQGENGLYEAETGKGVMLARENASIYFENEEELNEWVAEFRNVFAMIK